MKKLIVLLCTAALILSMFTGCNQEEGGAVRYSPDYGNHQNRKSGPLGRCFP